MIIFVTYLILIYFKKIFFDYDKKKMCQKIESHLENIFQIFFCSLKGCKAKKFKDENDMKQNQCGVVWIAQKKITFIKKPFEDVDKRQG